MSGCRIFIGRLNPSAREKDVERFFKGYGRIRDIDLKRGFGFVEFDDPRDAEDAVYELDGKELCNERVTIEHARVRLRGGRGRGGGGGGGGRFPDRYGRGSQDGRSRNPPPMRTENRLIVENLSSRVSWQDLKDFMRQAGEVTFADAHRPKLNEGVVEFASYSDLKNALEKLSGKEINGRKIKLIEAAKKRSRSRSRSESSSRSRSRSRGRSPSRSPRRSRSHSPAKAHNRSRSPSGSPPPGNSSPAPRAKEPAKRSSKTSKSATPPSPPPAQRASRSRSRSRSRSPSTDSQR
ncbi:serine and arginine rich splicing factor 5b [Diretmus argenteus]